MENIIDIKNLDKNFGDVHAVNDLSFKIEKGEAVALFGKNGAGKSTILKMITGVAYPTTGEITVNGRVSALLELTVDAVSEPRRNP